MNIKRAAIVYNPMSGRPGRRVENVRAMIDLLAARGIDAEARATEGPEHAVELARQVVAEGAGTIVSYGGDGTLNEVLQGMAGSETLLAVWPGGTANVVACDLGMPFDIKRLADAIAARRIQRVALGVANLGERNATEGEIVAASYAEGETRKWEDEARLAPSPPRSLSPSPSLSPTRSRYFLMMAGIGLDASIARSVNKKLKRRTGEFAYWVTGVQHLFTWQGQPFTLEVDGKRYESTFAVIGNGKGYGGGMRITHGARLEEPWFQVYIVPPLANNFLYLRALAGCMRGKPEVAGAILVRGSRIRAASAHESWVEADGEIIGTLPMTFDVVPDALSIIVP